MTFSDTPSGQIILKSKHVARRTLDATDAGGVWLGQWIARNPRKFIGLLVFEGWVHSLVVHHLKEAKDLMSMLNPF